MWIYKKKKKETVVKIIFFSWGSLTWWAIGASLIAISAEQFIGGISGFKMGLAIATYEWMAAFTLIIVAVFFIPVYLKKKFSPCLNNLNQRYSNVAMIMAVFWLLLYV
jgi:SSS family solute:Na+ symporter